jgi:hypothetical protein
VAIPANNDHWRVEITKRGGGTWYIDAYDVMADIGETGTGHKTNVARTDDCKVHD